jgi:hypothetical protein
VKEDVAIIVREALKMRQVVESLLEFWRPPEQGEQRCGEKKYGGAGEMVLG